MCACVCTFRLSEKKESLQKTAASNVDNVREQRQPVSVDGDDDDADDAVSCQKEFWVWSGCLRCV